MRKETKATAIDETFGIALRKRRVAADYENAERLAEKIGVTGATIREWERNVRLPPLKYRQRLWDVLRLDDLPSDGAELKLLAGVLQPTSVVGRLDRYRSLLVTATVCCPPEGDPEQRSGHELRLSPGELIVHARQARRAGYDGPAIEAGLSSVPESFVDDSDLDGTYFLIAAMLAEASEPFCVGTARLYNGRKDMMKEICGVARFPASDEPASDDGECALHPVNPGQILGPPATGDPSRGQVVVDRLAVRRFSSGELKPYGVDDPELLRAVTKAALYREAMRAARALAARRVLALARHEDDDHLLREYLGLGFHIEGVCAYRVYGGNPFLHWVLAADFERLEKRPSELSLLAWASRHMVAVN